MIILHPERLSPGDIRMTPTITRNGSCSLGLLCSVDKPDVMITWSNLHGGDVNVTGGVLYVPPSDVTLTYICTAHNPVSNVSKTVIPGEYCETARKDFTPRNLIRLILSGIVLLLTGGVFIHHLKTEVMEAPGGR
ncbi:hypothetical protein GDO81_014827 [Engystomops pustulosus]|uniref:Ig-like domain-containing protein n=1 Tax=Engystomops pustulosus TaxID=76066 RepID=A0AAV7AL54_ENGPU|nr:hypothetical protein GDO81_014827 [Engystomops pustulosus]